MKNENLKPCPFCGKKPYIEQLHPEWEKTRYYINCINDDCPMEDVRSGQYTDKQEVIDRWNGRIKEK